MLPNDIFDPETGTLDLFKIDKNKSWLIFYKKGCSGCSATLKYFWDNNIRYKAYDLDNAKGLSVAVFYGIIKECEKFVPVIIEDE